MAGNRNEEFDKYGGVFTECTANFVTAISSLRMYNEDPGALPKGSWAPIRMTKQGWGRVVAGLGSDRALMGLVVPADVPAVGSYDGVYAIVEVYLKDYCAKMTRDQNTEALLRLVAQLVWNEACLFVKSGRVKSSLLPRREFTWHLIGLCILRLHPEDSGVNISDNSYCNFLDVIHNIGVGADIPEEEARRADAFFSALCKPVDCNFSLCKFAVQIRTACGQSKFTQYVLDHNTLEFHINTAVMTVTNVGPTVHPSSPAASQAIACATSVICSDDGRVSPVYSVCTTVGVEEDELSVFIGSGGCPSETGSEGWFATRRGTGSSVEAPDSENSKPSSGDILQSGGATKPRPEIAPPPPLGHVACAVSAVRRRSRLVVMGEALL